MISSFLNLHIGKEEKRENRNGSADTVLLKLCAEDSPRIKQAGFLPLSTLSRGVWLVSAWEQRGMVNRLTGLC